MWYVAKVLEEPRLKGVKPFEGDISTYHLGISLERLDNIPDVDTFDNYYYDYIKQDDVIDLGYYAKDIYPAPFALEVSLPIHYYITSLYHSLFIIPSCYHIITSPL